MTLHVRVQQPGSARGEDEIEYWRSRNCGSIVRNVPKGMSVFGNRSSKSSGLTRLSLTSGSKASSFSRPNSVFSGSSAVNLSIDSMF